MSSSSDRAVSRAPSRTELAMLCAIAGGAALTRLYGIRVESLWLDEATSLMLARMDLPTLVRWTAGDIHPPLYYALLHFWIGLGESEAILRGLSALAGMLNVLVIYGLGRALFDGTCGLIGASLLALNPFHVWYSQETRMYAWGAFLFSASALSALAYWRRPGGALLVCHVLATIAGLYTHYYATFAILLVNLTFGYLWLRGRLARRSVYAWIGAQAAIALLFFPWLPNLLAIMGGGGGWLAFSEGRPPLAALAQTAVFYMVGPAREAYPLIARRLCYLLVAVALALGVWAGIRRRSEDRPGGVSLVGKGTQGALQKGGEGQEPVSGCGRTRASSAGPGSPLPEEGGSRPLGPREAVWFLVVYLGLPLGIAWVSSQFFKPMYSARYMLPFLIPFLLLAARGVQRVPGCLASGILLGALLLTTGAGVLLQGRTLEKPDWRGMAARLIAASQPDDLVFFMPGWHVGPFEYYARGALPTYSDMPLLMDRYDEAALAHVDEAIAGHARVWFVWEKGHYTDPEGVVYRRVQARCHEVSVTPMPLLGEIVLFECPADAAETP
ncbi:MAG: hypothetical protein FJZ90_11630 [Chloroflexi bacterium]|nr:hypothetical protein [Chloroflexota bacterium]